MPKLMTLMPRPSRNMHGVTEFTDEQDPGGRAEARASMVLRLKQLIPRPSRAGGVMWATSAPAVVLIRPKATPLKKRMADNSGRVGAY